MSDNDGSGQFATGGYVTFTTEEWASMLRPSDSVIYRSQVSAELWEILTRQSQGEHNITFNCNFPMNSYSECQDENRTSE